ncbi:MAG TPA: hypothetical protein VMV49_01170 [Candidatus Deferrimicrobium sp.]|nr:hypothetical protein [Candidatus Deferrimicrobium sp.]
MSDKECKNLAEQALKEPNLIKRGMLFNKASQCYKENANLDQYKLMKEEAIKAFQQEAENIRDYYEKALANSYEALCWICLGAFERAETLVDDCLELESEDPKCKLPLIRVFTKFLASKEVNKAEVLWKDLYQNFSEGIIDLMKEAFISVNPTLCPPSLVVKLVISKTWEIVMAGKNPSNPEEDWNITFYDASEIFKEQIIISKQFVEDLLKTIKENESYRFIRNIKTVKSSIEEDLSDKALYVILATSTTKELKFGILIGSLKEGGLHVIAVWPEAFAQASVEDRDLIKVFISRIINDPSWFKDVNIVAFISTEEEKKKDTETKEGSEDIGLLPGYYT